MNFPISFRFFFLEFQIIRFVNSNFMKIFFIEISFVFTPPRWSDGRCGAEEATGMGFVCFVVINPCVLSANRVDFGFFCFINFPILLPHSSDYLEESGLLKSLYALAKLL